MHSITHNIYIVVNNKHDGRIVGKKNKSAYIKKMSAASSNNRIREYLQSLPTVTVALLLFNITIHVAIFVTSASLGKYAISVNMVNCIFFRNNIFASTF